ncbi:pyrimidine dimer DNA glycosylase/endonuclease V [Moheibacter sp.]|uniref:pyrimidine dimer DNA glycosylase/endonuclease V n=1 Tax=Moheibacter sp. TaxID=1965316 RepID=UPI003C71CA30
MRLWSLHPKYLDAKGLVALWRETLLAKNVLEGKTKGYQNHPQLIRFKEMENPVEAIHQYLAEIWLEADKRGYKFDKSKINWEFVPQNIKVNDGQMAYEFKHLLRKLEIRDTSQFYKLKDLESIDPAEIFTVIPGEIEKWEIV